MEEVVGATVETRYAASLLQRYGTLHHGMVPHDRDNDRRPRATCCGAGGAFTQSSAVIVMAERRHHMHVAPITNGSRKVR